MADDVDPARELTVLLDDDEVVDIEDVQRISDGATGQFHDDFVMWSKPFVDVVKQAKSISVGTNH